jgi:hypothetical protein
VNFEKLEIATDNVEKLETIHATATSAKLLRSVGFVLLYISHV